jgi:2-iminoacetate synthase
VSFVKEFNTLPLAALVQRSLQASTEAARSSLAKAELSLSDFARLISPAGAELLEPLSRRSQQMTRQRFGKVIRLFAPLYLSNECINACQYCGFSRDNPILRVTLTPEEVRREARALLGQGFRNILLVSGEHPKFVSTDYMARCVSLLHEEVPSLSLEIGPMETAEYRPLVQAGAEGLVVYQETYDRAVYAAMHTAGPKRNFEWRMETPSGPTPRASGALASAPSTVWATGGGGHQRRRPRRLSAAQLLESPTDDLPAPAAPVRRGVSAAHPPERPRTGATGLRLPPHVSRCRPRPLHAGTAQAAQWADPARHYAHQRRQPHRAGRLHRRGQRKLHHTERGRIVELGASEWATPDHRPVHATSQFQIADERSPREVAD